MCKTFDMFCDEQKIRKCLENVSVNDPYRKMVGGRIRPAAVLVPMLCINHEWNILFTRRTETVNSHKGQVSFPGGAIENSDKSPEDGAIRETYEELGINAGSVNVLGRLSKVSTISGFSITPIVASVEWPLDLRLEKEEVSKAFYIPVDWLSCPDHYEKKTINLMGRVVDGVVFFKPYDGEILWGITAMITLQLIHLIRDRK